jgi:hypothetical protein
MYTFLETLTKSEITPEVKKIVGKSLDYNHALMTVNSITIGYSKNSLFFTLTDQNQKESRRALIEQDKINLIQNVDFVKRLYEEDTELTAFTSLNCEEFYDYE